jgi:hypothetical protein
MVSLLSAKSFGGPTNAVAATPTAGTVVHSILIFLRFIVVLPPFLLSCSKLLFFLRFEECSALDRRTSREAGRDGLQAPVRPSKCCY